MKQKRKSSLDALRALAIFAVVNCHTAVFFTENGDTSWLTRLLGMGGHGVDLFFVLSGWLLGNIIFSELSINSQFNARRFIARRWLRTLPVYFAVLFATLVQISISKHLDLKAFSYAVFLQAYEFGELPFLYVSWSLCVEEHFYLLIALAFAFFAKRKRVLLTALILCVIFPQLFRLTGLYVVGYETHVRVDQCAAGVLLAFVYNYWPHLWSRFQKILPLLVFLSLIGIMAFSTNRIFSLDLPEPLFIYTLISLTLVGLAERTDKHRSVRIPFAEYLATRSYSLYFMHVEALAVARRLECSDWISITLVTWSLGLLFSEVLYRLVELPFMRLRNTKRIDQYLTPAAN